MIPFGLLYMRPLQWWLRTKRFSLRGNPFRMIKVTRRCLRALVMWKKPWFQPALEASCRRKMLMTDASLTGWGAILEARSRSRKSQGPPWARQLRQHIGGLLHKLPGGFAVMSTCKLACQICVCHILAIHWGLKIRNDRSVQETEQYLYIFVPLIRRTDIVRSHRVLIWFCLCMFFLSLKAVSPFDSNYKSDRLQRFESKIVVCVLLKKQSLGCPCGKQINIKLTFWVNYPFKKNGNELFN